MSYPRPMMPLSCNSNLVTVFLSEFIRPLILIPDSAFIGVEETVVSVLRRYGSFHELKGRNITFDR
jgi:hypothetical protein